MTYTDLRNYLTWHYPNLAPDHPGQDWACTNYRIIQADLPSYFESQHMLVDYRNWLSQVDQVASYYQDDNQGPVAQFLASQLGQLSITAHITDPAISR
ncbi:hypothetical protein [Aerococcus urinaehominis]|uniref:hypothetical protein n=1 Tax=Aerococcus urinaehominis TaxID=128944 RepID=UPI0011A024B0|nr:hypothetical protein [Aerococcus urinaehominis]